MIVFIHAQLTITTFSTSSLQDKLLHCVSCTWCSLPFRDLHGIHHGEDTRQEWFLLILHSVENMSLVTVFVLYYCPVTVYTKAFLYFILPCIISTLLSFLLHLLYIKKVKLFAGLPDIPTVLQEAKRPYVTQQDTMAGLPHPPTKVREKSLHYESRINLQG